MDETILVTQEKDLTVLEFEVNDGAAAWKCALDFESLINVLSREEGTVICESGLNREEGAVVVKKHTITSASAEYRNTMHIAEAYKFVKVDDLNKTIKIDYEMTHNEKMADKYEVSIYLKPSQNDNSSRIVRFELQTNFYEKSLAVAKLLSCGLCLCLAPLFWPCIEKGVKLQGAKSLEKHCINIRTHFNTYKMTKFADTEIKGEITL